MAPLPTRAAGPMVGTDGVRELRLALRVRLVRLIPPPVPIIVRIGTSPITGFTPTSHGN